MKVLNALGIFSLGCALIACQVKSESVETIASTSPVQEWDATLYVEMQNELGEGAIYNQETKEFWHIDIEGKQFFTTDIKTKEQKTFDVGQRIGTIVPNDLGQAIVALQSGLYTYDFESKTQNLITNPLDSIDNIRFNDGKCDPAGRLWVGSMGLDQKSFRASLYSLEKGVANQQLDSITISNGIVWSKDQKTMYYIDTPDENVKAFDYDVASGKISNGRVVVEIGGIGYPDGMAIDAEDKLWIALWNGNMVSRWDPNTGELIGKINVPAHNITSVAFVGEQLDSLIITSARVDMSDEELEKYPLAGSLFVAVPGVKGVKSNFYKTQDNAQ
ncbi:MAG: SMP-30/gluconolactonase/LRE family protein [Reichenbachiella sp.]|uniref:SMP-30/gluconolactonase/LRE family protein n=1 Tax=Reichenbachiella sp. TaxID=2184521 RepID=UPI002966AB85|nr:SMP-30/gluconolactonase/LRE family protein [Reichenbachiella sp.]MDW3210790.1 SMP-30/gluconolactonase/LRE family protein [Reichenbachiella sp.]